MDILLKKLSKRYRYEWIFRNIDYTFLSGKRYAVLGPNGSGKSTLLQSLSGYLSPSKGSVTFFKNGQEIPADTVYPSISYAAPYIELIEDLTLAEMLTFHRGFKKMLLSNSELLELMGLEKAQYKPIKFFSSGMKQRLKLALACCSDTPLLLLDEPTTNLDQQGVNWYRSLIEQFTNNRLTIIASNIAHDYDFCDASFSILDFKSK